MRTQKLVLDRTFIGAGALKTAAAALMATLLLAGCATDSSTVGTPEVVRAGLSYCSAVPVGTEIGSVDVRAVGPGPISGGNPSTVYAVDDESFRVTVFDMGDSWDLGVEVGSPDPWGCGLWWVLPKGEPEAEATSSDPVTAALAGTLWFGYDSYGSTWNVFFNPDGTLDITLDGQSSDMPGDRWTSDPNQGVWIDLDFGDGLTAMGWSDPVYTAGDTTMNLYVTLLDDSGTWFDLTLEQTWSEAGPDAPQTPPVPTADNAKEAVVVALATYCQSPTEWALTSDNWWSTGLAYPYSLNHRFFRENGFWEVSTETPAGAVYLTILPPTQGVEPSPGEAVVISAADGFSADILTYEWGCSNIDMSVKVLTVHPN